MFGSYRVLTLAMKVASARLLLINCLKAIRELWVFINKDGMRLLDKSNVKICIECSINLPLIWEDLAMLVGF